jgi:hypothetical protein
MLNNSADIDYRIESLLRIPVWYTSLWRSIFGRKQHIDYISYQPGSRNFDNSFQPFAGNY